MTTRMEKEFELLRSYFRSAEWHEKEPTGWIKIPDFPIPIGIWNRERATICLEVPQGYPGAAPYGFYVEGGLRLSGNNAVPQSYTEPAETVFEGLWGKFSWATDNSWQPAEDLVAGSNLLNFVQSFKDRLSEGA